MLETTHAIVAGAIANHVKDPAAAISFSFFSHFILDAVPHWDFGTNWRSRRKLYTGICAIADVCIGFIVGYILFRNTVPLPLLFAAITASMLPDWLEAPWYIFFAHKDKREPGKHAGFFEKCTYKIYKTENTFHAKTGVVFGILTQVATAAFFFFLLK